MTKNEIIKMLKDDLNRLEEEKKKFEAEIENDVKTERTKDAFLYFQGEINALVGALLKIRQQA